MIELDGKTMGYCEKGGEGEAEFCGIYCEMNKEVLRGRDCEI